MRWRLGRSGQITVVTAALLGGVAIERLCPAGLDWLVAVAAIIVFGLFGVRFGILIIAVLVFGAWRANTTDFTVTQLGRHLGQQVDLTGVVSDDPAVNDKNQTSFTLYIERIEGGAASANLRITTAAYKELQRGYEVAARGKLQPSLGGIRSQVSFAAVDVVSEHQTYLEKLRQRFLGVIRGNMPEPLSGFALGLLIGARALIDKPTQATLNAVGLSHLIAVSGYNLTIIVRAVHRILRPISAYTVAAVSLWMVLGFLAVAGFSASIVRAAIVSVISIWTSYYGYHARPMTMICLPALITVACKPDYLIYDAGWQLSFLAFFGILVVAPALEVRLGGAENPLRSLIIESLAAQALTAPCIAVLFGNFSVVGPVANAIILPLVPVAMAASFALGVVGMLIPSAASLLVLPSTGLLGLMLGLVQWFAIWPSANVQMGLPIFTVIVIYGLIIMATAAAVRGARKSIAQAKNKHYHFDMTDHPGQP